MMPLGYEPQFMCHCNDTLSCQATENEQDCSQPSIQSADSDVKALERTFLVSQGVEVT